MTKSIIKYQCDFKTLRRTIVELNFMALSDSGFLIANHFQNSVDAAVTIQRPT